MARGRGLALMGGMVVGGAMVSSRSRAKQRAYQAGQQAEQEHQQQVQQQVAQQQQIEQLATTAAPNTNITVELQKLADLNKSGVLSDEEFAAAKKKLLGV